jgi:hypothetical protein
VPAIAADTSTSEELLQHVQNLHTSLSLNHCEARLDLPTNATRGVPKDWNAEAAFTVDEADDPLCNTWPFLLIVRAGRIVTHALTLPRGSDSKWVAPDTRSFQQIASCTLRNYFREGQTRARFRAFYLRHSCYSSKERFSMEWLDHFCLAPYVAIGVGLYLHHRLGEINDAWRVVSEDPAYAVSC